MWLRLGLKWLPAGRRLPKSGKSGKSKAHSFSSLASTCS
jgi:hypothetical protein